MAIITISRTTFSKASNVAEALSEKLGYPCVSKEIIFDVAEEFGVSEAELIAAFEKPAKSWNQTPHRRVNHLSYVRYALLQRARNQNLVYHGYAGHLLLGDLSHLIRVRVIDNPEARIEMAMQQNQVNRKDALAVIEKQDDQNRKWVKFLYGVDWEHPALYDAVVNLERIDIEGAVAILEKMTQLDRFRPSAASILAFDNQLLSSLVWAALTKNPRTVSSYVRIAADNGKVTITGNLDSDRTVQTIREVVMQVDGVKQVTFEVGDDPDRLL